jgi:hypothetical protein
MIALDQGTPPFEYNAVGDYHCIACELNIFRQMEDVR